MFHYNCFSPLVDALCHLFDLCRVVLRVGRDQLGRQLVQLVHVTLVGVNFAVEILKVKLYCNEGI
jgi:hypothetical protein